MNAKPNIEIDEIDWNLADDNAADTQQGMPAFTDAPVAPVAHDLISVATEAASNANVQGIGSIAGGQMRGAGFASKEGYIQAIRNGVPEHTHRHYIDTLRARYGMTSADVAALNLPGPMAPNALPVGKGITHTPTGPDIFSRPRAERAFVVGPKAGETTSPDRVEYRAGDMVAGAVAEGHHAIIGWEGTSGMTRGALVTALEAIDRASWAPSAPNARAQAGAAIAELSRTGLDVRPAPRHANQATGEHHWTVGKVNHTGKVGDEYGEIRIAFTLKASVLSYTGDSTIGAPVVAAYNARVAAELYKSSDITSWLAQILRWNLGAVKFGTLGWLVPSKHASAAEALCTAVQGAGFGASWILPALPIATSDQLRDGIVRGLTDEVSDLMARLATERATAAAAKVSNAGRAGDLGEKRVETYLKDLRAIGGRVVAYGQILGEARVQVIRETIRKAVAELESVRGEDYSGIRERFDLIWEEIARDQQNVL